MKKTFDKELLKELIYCSPGEEFQGCKLVSIEDHDHTRWASMHTMIFEHDGKLWGSDFSRGLTEIQDQFPYDYDEPEAYEVEAHEVVTIKYKKKV